MSMAEKLKTIAENEQKVFDAGKQAGKATCESEFQEIKGVMGGYLADDTPISGYAEAISTALSVEHNIGYDEGSYDGYVNGKQAERDHFWDIVQDYGNRTAYNYAFRGLIWNDDNFFPKYDFRLTGQGTSMFYGVRITNLKQRLIDCGVTLDVSAVTIVNEMFANTTITHIPEVSFVGVTYQNTIGNAFSQSKYLHTIDKLTVNETQKFSNTFANCESLENLIIGGTIGQDGFDVHWSTKLSKASHVSIINALSATATGKTVTFSKTAINTAFGIDVDDETTWGEGTEFYALRHSKDNWTFSYV